MIKNLLLLSLLILSWSLTSQNYQTIEDVDDACSTLGFASDEEAELAVDRILDQIGLFRNFTIQECPDINNAVAKNIEVSPGQKERYILYDSEFFERIGDKANNDWAAISILAHEIGHHLNGHSLNDAGSNHRFELEADYFSGSALAKLGASMEEAQSAINTLKYTKATRTHPAKADRLESIERGWKKAKGISTVVTVEETNEEKALTAYRSGEIAYRDRDFIKALRLFNESKNLGYKDAYYYLANIFYFGRGVAVDELKAASYAQEGYNLGSIPSTYLYGKFIQKGRGVPKNEKEAKRLFEKNFQLNWFKKEYEKYKMPFHAYTIGYMYNNGYGGATKDEANGKIWFQQAADQGDISAILNLGSYYYNDGPEQNYQKARNLWEHARDAGSVFSLSMLSLLYRDGKGVLQDANKAIALLEEAAGHGIPSAMDGLGYIYRDGKGVPVNGQRAIYWYEKEAMIDPDGYSSIGWMYMNGRGVSKDYDKSYKYYKKAAELGSVEGMANVGFCYEYGRGVSYNWNEAARWYQKAAELGSNYGKWRIAHFYIFGVGRVSKDMNQAKKLLQQAADDGYSRAKMSLDVIRHAEGARMITLNSSNHGNRIWVSEANMRKEAGLMPWTMTKHDVSWGVPVEYEMGRATQVQIFPSESSNTDDDFYYSNYNSSPTFSDQRGQHNVNLSIKSTDDGYMGVRYAYFKGVFMDRSGDIQEELTIKVPLMVCWLPRNAY